MALCERDNCTILNLARILEPGSHQSGRCDVCDRRFVARPASSFDSEPTVQVFEHPITKMHGPTEDQNQ
jgi:hypothetical protein